MTMKATSSSRAREIIASKARRVQCRMSPAGQIRARLQAGQRAVQVDIGGVEELHPIFLACVERPVNGSAGRPARSVQPGGTCCRVVSDTIRGRNAATAEDYSK